MIAGFKHRDVFYSNVPFVHLTVSFKDGRPIIMIFNMKAVKLIEDIV
jgi:hypothetical protein